MPKNFSFLIILIVIAMVVPAVRAQSELLPGQFLEGDLNPHGLITIPLHQGQWTDGGTVWFIITDVSDETIAQEEGINYSPKLAQATAGIRAGSIDSDGVWVFESGRVDFSPERVVVPDEAPAFFPPVEFQPGSVGDEDYSPLVNIDGVVYNAPIVAADAPADAISFCDGSPDRSLVHDSVASICPEVGEVSIGLVPGFSSGHSVLYMSTDANLEMVAALEGATYAPAVADLSQDALEPIYIAINGQMGAENPHRQGMQSALSGEGSPLNVTGGVPTLGSDTYSPMWQVHLYVWTDEAIASGYRARLIAESQVLEFSDSGWITNPDGDAVSASGPIVNCSMVYRAD